MSDLAKMLDPRYGQGAGLLAGMLDPSVVKRGSFWPVGRTADGGWTLALPQGAIDAVNNFQSGMDAPVYYDEAGQMQMNPAVTETALNVAGTGYTGASMQAIRHGLPKNTLAAHVWQGSPHKYGPEGARESLKHIGKGEGAQAYGWGRYDAQSKAVAQDYADNVKNMGPIREINDELKRLSRVMDEDSAHGYRNFKTDKGRQAAAEYDALMDKRAEITASQGNMYMHDLPDEDIARYLDWDAPLSEQPESVRAALGANLDNPLDQYEPGKIGYGDNAWGLFTKADGLYDTEAPHFPTEEAARAFLSNPTGSEYYRQLKGVYGSDKAASEALARAGIPGLKYYDGMSRGAGDLPSKGGLLSAVQAGGKIYTGQTHLDALSKVPSQLRARAQFDGDNRGFVDYRGKYLDRYEAQRYAIKNKLIKQNAPEWAYSSPELISENMIIKDPRTRNFVTWDQDVLNRMKLLERNGVSLAEMLAAE